MMTVNLIVIQDLSVLPLNHSEVLEGSDHQTRFLVLDLAGQPALVSGFKFIEIYLSIGYIRTAFLFYFYYFYYF